MKGRRYASKRGFVERQVAQDLARRQETTDVQEGVVHWRRQASAGPGGLLGRLLARAAAPVVRSPEEAQAGEFQQLAARTWDEVTGGAGVVLVDGKEVKLLPPGEAKGGGRD